MALVLAVKKFLMGGGQKNSPLFKEQLSIALSAVLKILGGDVLGYGKSHLEGAPLPAL